MAAFAEGIKRGDKMTDNEIIKALECCTVKNSCAGCPLRKETICTETRKFLAFDLIKRQQAEIERLKAIEKRDNDYRKAIMEANKIRQGEERYFNSTINTLNELSAEMVGADNDL